jgi:hypothetical protein
VSSEVPESREPFRPTPSTKSAIEWHAIRAWKSADGKFTTEAKIKSLAFETVKLEKADGTVISITLSQLSDEDQSFVQAYKKAMNKLK